MKNLIWFIAFWPFLTAAREVVPFMELNGKMAQPPHTPDLKKEPTGFMEIDGVRHTLQKGPEKDPEPQKTEFPLSPEREAPPTPSGENEGLIEKMGRELINKIEPLRKTEEQLKDRDDFLNKMEQGL